MYAVASQGAGFMADSVQFRIPLARDLAPSEVHFVTAGTTTECPGLGQAASGHLCVYELQQSVRSNPAVNKSNGTDGADAGGFMVFMNATNTGYSYGTWTVTG